MSLGEGAYVLGDSVVADLYTQGNDVGKLIASQLIELVYYGDTASVRTDAPQLSGLVADTGLSALTDASSSASTMTLTHSKPRHGDPLAGLPTGSLGRTPCSTG